MGTVPDLFQPRHDPAPVDSRLDSRQAQAVGETVKGVRGARLATRVVRALPEEDWRRFVEQHPHGNIFHTPEIFQVFARTRGYRPELWAATDGEGQVLALMLPVQIALGARLPSFLTTRAVAYGSVLCDPSPAGEEGLVAMLRAYGREVDRRVLFTELRNLSDLSNVQGALNHCGFVHEDHLNYLIDLDRPLDGILQSIGQRTRKQIRRGIRSGEVVIKEIVEREQISLCYELLRRTYAATRVPLADRSLFEATFDVLHPLGMVKFLMAWVGDACVATSVELVYKKTIHGWYGGASREYGSHVPNELLMWHILAWGARNGRRVYDFGGAGKPGEQYGVRDFKAKFGGTLVNFGRNTRVHAPLRLMFSRRGYELLRRFL